MDRNTALATVLIGLIIAVWMIWFSPEPPPVEQAPPPPESGVVEEVAPRGDTMEQPQVVEQEAPTPVTLAPAVSADSALASAQSGTEELITVENDLYVAKFSTKGGTIKSFRLKEYMKFDQVTPVEMIDTLGYGALSLLMTSRTGPPLDTRSLFFEADNRGTVDATSGERSLTFTSNLGAGSLTLEYTFRPGTYVFDLNIDQENAAAYSQNDGYEIVWTGGIPFSEGDATVEATTTAAYASSGGELVKIGLDKEEREGMTVSGQVDWVAVKETFFSAFILPSNETNLARLEGVRSGDPDEDNIFENYIASIEMGPTPPEGDHFQLYVGPLENERLDAFDKDMYSVVDYGFGKSITRPIAEWLIIPAFGWLGKLIPNYGLVIILFASLIKLILFPLTKSSFKSMARMKTLQPAMAEIKEKYPDDPEKQQKATMALYKESGVNPLGSCLPQLLQLPILYALFRFFPSAIEIRQKSFLWAKDLSAPDVILNLPFDLPLYGGYVAGFCLLMGVSMAIQMQIQGMAGTSGAQAKIFMYVMPVFLVVIFNRFSSGLSLYYLTYNIWSAVQQRFINRQIDSENAAKELEEASSVPTKKQRREKASSNGQAKKGKGGPAKPGKKKAGKK